MECCGKVTTSGRAVVTYLLEAVSLSTHRAVTAREEKHRWHFGNFRVQITAGCREGEEVPGDRLKDGEGIGDDEREADDGEAAALNLNKIYFGVTEQWPQPGIIIFVEGLSSEY